MDFYILIGLNFTTVWGASCGQFKTPQERFRGPNGDIQYDMHKPFHVTSQTSWFFIKITLKFIWMSGTNLDNFGTHPWHPVTSSSVHAEFQTSWCFMENTLECILDAWNQVCQLLTPDKHKLYHLSNFSFSYDNSIRIQIECQQTIPRHFWEGFLEGMSVLN